MSADAVIRALADKTGFEVVQRSGGEMQLRLVGRLPTNRTPDLLALLDVLTDPYPDWSGDFSKWYFKPMGAPERVYAWRFIFESKDPTRALPFDSIAAVIMRATPATRVASGGPLEEIRLPGSGAHRNQYNARGKGAAPMGQAVVGPMRRGM